MSGSMPITYLVCVTDSDASRVALRFACERARKRGGRVEVLHVLPPADFQSFHLVADRMLDERRSEAEAMLARMIEEMHHATGIIVSIDIRHGNVGDEIAIAARAQNAPAMLVIAADPDARAGLLATLTGQLGEKLPIPLLLVPAVLTAEQIAFLS